MSAPACKVGRGMCEMGDSLRRAFMREIEMLVEQLKAYAPQKIILFGSCARGDFSDESDIDMLIIKESDKLRPARATEVYRLLRSLRRTIPFEPLVYTPVELERSLAMGDPFIEDVLSEGKVLYERPASE